MSQEMLNQPEIAAENNTVLNQEAHKEATKKEEARKFSNEEVEDIIKQRLKKARDESAKREAELAARHDAMSKELDTLRSQAPTNMSGVPGVTGAQPVSPQAAVAQAEAVAARNPELTEEIIDRMVEQKQKSKEFGKKLEDAIKEDEEFKKLADKANTGPISDDMILNMQHIDNAPAVIKHLLKNGKDYAMMQAAYDASLASGNRVHFVKFVNEMSDKLEATQAQTKPKPSEFSPSPDLHGVSESGDDFDVADYISTLR